MYFDQSEELIGEVRHILCEAKGDGVKTDVNGPRNCGQQNTDDTAIVQSVGAPFAALQWREEDSLNNFRFVSLTNLSHFEGEEEHLQDGLLIMTLPWCGAHIHKFSAEYQTWQVRTLSGSGCGFQ